MDNQWTTFSIVQDMFWPSGHITHSCTHLVVCFAFAL